MGEAHQTKPRTITLRPILTVSTKAFTAIWWCLQLFHVVSVVFALCVLRVCRYFIVGELVLSMSFLGEDAFWFLHVIVVTCTVLIIFHSFAFLQSAWWSTRYRELRHTGKVRTHSAVAQLHIADTAKKGGISAQPSDATAALSRPSFLMRSVRGFTKFASAAFSIQGRHYDTFFFAIEVVEISFQVYQAFKLSTLVPRVWINRLYAAVLVLNCWSTVFVYATLPGNLLTKRFVLVAVDVAFDLITSVVIPTAIFVPYYLQFDFDVQDFPFHYYYDDVWFIQAVSENRQIFVMSWLDFVTKLVSFLTTFGVILALKKSIVVNKMADQAPALANSTSVVSSADAPTTFIHRMLPAFSLRWVTVTSGGQTRVHPESLDARRTESIISDATVSSITGSERLAMVNIQRGEYKFTWRDAVLSVGGLVILVIHIHATVIGVNSHTTNCLLEMRPWFSNSQSCATLEVNCARGQHAHGADIDSLGVILGQINPDEVKVVVFSSCARLHVPHTIQAFSALEMIKIYNSTVEVWDKSAELRDDLHRELLFLYVSDSNFSNGELPAGMLGDNFPTRLVDVELSGTNLVGLPSDLDEKWISTALFVLERSPAITEFPESLARMPITHLVLRQNGIVSIPDELLVDKAYSMLLLDSNPLKKLPKSIGHMTGLFRVGISFTSFSELPDWITTAKVDAATGKPIEPTWGTIALLAESTILCDGDTARQSAVWDQLPRYFDVTCSSIPPSFGYPIEYERVWRARSQALLE